MTKIKLSQYAKENGIGYKAAWNRFHAGKIPNASLSSVGTIQIELEKPSKPECNVIYARVSTNEQKNDLESQITRITQFANSRGIQIHKVVKEIASGLNDQRPKLIDILNDEKISLIIIENKDRLTRFGFNYIKTLLKFKQCDILIMNESLTDKDDLISDFVLMIKSFYNEIYSKKISKMSIKKIINNIEKEEE